MNCKLSKADCAEIYHALGLVRARLLQLRLGEDGEQLANTWLKLNKADAYAIYRALTEKRERIMQGMYDSYSGEVDKAGSFPFTLAKHVSHILAMIGYRGESLTLDSDSRYEFPDGAINDTRYQSPDLALEGLRASLQQSENAPGLASNELLGVQEDRSSARRGWLGAALQKLS